MCAGCGEAAGGPCAPLCRGRERGSPGSPGPRDGSGHGGLPGRRSAGSRDGSAWVGPGRALSHSSAPHTLLPCSTHTCALLPLRAVDDRDPPPSPVSGWNQGEQPGGLGLEGRGPSGVTAVCDITSLCHNCHDLKCTGSL